MCLPRAVLAVKLCAGRSVGAGDPLKKPQQTLENRVTLKPVDASAIIMLGEQSRRRNSFDEARGYFQQALSLPRRTRRLPSDWENAC